MKGLQLITAALLGTAFGAVVLIAEPGIGVAVRALAIHTSPRDGSATPVAPKSSAMTVSITDLHEGGISHYLGPTISVRTKDATWGSEPIKLTLIVDERGSVIAATARSGPKEHFAEAERLARTIKFVPFRRGGVPVAAKITTFLVHIYPPEQRPDYPVEFPVIKNLDSLVITMRRVGGGGGYLYDLEIRGNGAITFKGWTGTHHATLSRARIDSLVDELRRLKFFWLNDSYSSPATDQAFNVVHVSFDGRTKGVFDYAGREGGMPDAMVDVERAIDSAVQVDRWTRGNAETGPSLLAEHWNFKEANDANQQMLCWVARSGSVGALRDLIALGAPLNTGAKGSAPGCIPLIAAADRGDPEMLGALLGQQVTWSPAALGEALVAAAEKPNEDMVLSLLWRNADPRYQNGKDWNSKTPLMAACNSGSREVSELLLRWISKSMSAAAAGVPSVRTASPAEVAAFVNMRDINGRTALFWVLDGRTAPVDGAAIDRRGLAQMLLKAGALVEVRDRDGNTPLIVNSLDAGITADLIAAGAKVNARNKDGRTALMESFDSANTLTLLNAGAEPTLRDKEGHTALDLSMEYGGRETTVVLQKWLAEHPARSSK